MMEIKKNLEECIFSPQMMCYSLTIKSIVHSQPWGKQPIPFLSFLKTFTKKSKPLLKYFARVKCIMQLTLAKYLKTKNDFVLEKKQYYIFKTSEDTFHYLKNTKFVQLNFICVYLSQNIKTYFTLHGIQCKLKNM